MRPKQWPQFSQKCGKLVKTEAAVLASKVNIPDFFQLIMKRRMEVLPCLILPMIKFFVIIDTKNLIKYQITALILVAFFIKKVFLYV